MAWVELIMFICGCLCKTLHDYVFYIVKQNSKLVSPMYVLSIALHKNVAGSFSHEWEKLCNMTINSYGVIRLETLKTVQAKLWYGVNHQKLR